MGADAGLHWQANGSRTGIALHRTHHEGLGMQGDSHPPTPVQRTGHTKVACACDWRNLTFGLGEGGRRWPPVSTCFWRQAALRLLVLTNSHPRGAPRGGDADRKCGQNRPWWAGRTRWQRLPIARVSVAPNPPPTAEGSSAVTPGVVGVRGGREKEKERVPVLASVRLRFFSGTGPTQSSFWPSTAGALLTFPATATSWRNFTGRQSPWSQELALAGAPIRVRDGSIPFRHCRQTRPPKLLPDLATTFCSLKRWAG